MILHNIINDRVIITYTIGENWWETNVYLLNEDGQMIRWLEQRDSYKEQRAVYRHELMVGLQNPQEPKICKYCDQPALNFNGLMREWLCYHHFNIFVRERT